MQCIRAAVAVTLGLSLAACGGGGSSHASSAVPSVVGGNGTVAGPIIGVAMVTNTVPLSEGKQAITLPSAGGITASMTLTLGALTGAPSAQIIDTASPTLSAATLKTLQGANAATPTPVYSTQFSPTGGVTLQGLPDFSVTAPAFAGVDPSKVSYTLFDGADCTSVVASSQRAIYVNGSTATFSANSTNMALAPGHTYVFVFYVASNQSLKLWTTNGSSLVGMQLSVDNIPIVTNDISGPETLFSSDSDVVLDDKDRVLASAAAPDSFYQGFYHGSNSYLVGFPTNATGNVSPILKSNVVGGQFSMLRGSPNGKHLFAFMSIGHADFGREGSRESLVSSDNDDTLTRSEIPDIHDDYQAVAVGDDGTDASFYRYIFSPGGDGHNQQILEIGSCAFYYGFTEGDSAPIGTSSDGCGGETRFATFPYPDLRYSELAVQPNSGNIVAPLGQAIDIYPSRGQILGAPIGHLQLPSGYANPLNLAFSRDGRLFVTVDDADGKAALVEYPRDAKSGTPASHIYRLDGLGYAVRQFAIQSP